MTCWKAQIFQRKFWKLRYFGGTSEKINQIIRNGLAWLEDHSSAYNEHLVGMILNEGRLVRESLWSFIKVFLENSRKGRKVTREKWLLGLCPEGEDAGLVPLPVTPLFFSLTAWSDSFTSLILCFLFLLSKALPCLFPLFNVTGHSTGLSDFL